MISRSMLKRIIEGRLRENLRECIHHARGLSDKSRQERMEAADWCLGVTHGIMLAYLDVDNARAMVWRDRIEFVGSRLHGAFDTPLSKRRCRAWWGIEEAQVELAVEILRDNYQRERGPLNLGEVPEGYWKRLAAEMEPEALLSVLREGADLSIPKLGPEDKHLLGPFLKPAQPTEPAQPAQPTARKATRNEEREDKLLAVERERAALESAAQGALSFIAEVQDHVLAESGFKDMNMTPVQSDRLDRLNTLVTEAILRMERLYGRDGPIPAEGHGLALYVSRLEEAIALETRPGEIEHDVAVSGSMTACRRAMMPLRRCRLAVRFLRRHGGCSLQDGWRTPLVLSMSDAALRVSSSWQVVEPPRGRALLSW
jgi:hypothetical protein